MNFHYQVTTPEGGIVQELRVKGEVAEYFSYNRATRKTSEGQFKLSAGRAATLTTLVEKIQTYTCQPARAADNQNILITLGKIRIRCTEARMDENKDLDRLIQKVRALIAAQVRGN
ncbi:hypothetical protein [Deinococcus hohokamensis]|uniref:Uncharacterized protein n=1 Tax=Deinococcus hohokamensis TaxID=309883 RepID=A0ABV9IE78_9DEIO